MGGAAKLAQALCVSRPTIHQWSKGIRRVPAERCLEIERVTQGAVRCEDLRPDVEWCVLRAPSTSDKKGEAA